MSETYDKFDYVLQLAFQFEEVDYDDEGNSFVQPHYTYGMFTWKAEDIINDLCLSEDDFYKQNSILAVLDAYHLNHEQFWYAVAYVRYLTSMWSSSSNLELLPTSVDQLTRFRDEIKGRKSFKVVIDNPTESHSFLIEGSNTIARLYDGLENLITEAKHAFYADGHQVKSWDFPPRRKTEETWYAASMFSRLFKALKLPSIRGRNTHLSYDKNQLIADLIHYMGLTDNEDLDGNSIKGNLKKPLGGIGFW